MNYWTVLFVNDSALMLSEIERGADGRISRGLVDNGAWWLRIEGNMLFVDRSRYEDAFPIFSYEEVRVPSRRLNPTRIGFGFEEFYNQIIQQAEEMRSSGVALPGDLSNMRQRLQNTWDRFTLAR